MDLDTAVGIGTLVAVLTGLVFGATQVQMTARRRKAETTAQLITSFLDTDIKRAYPIIRALPDDCDPAVIRRDPETRTAAESMDMFFEAHGMLVDRGVLQLGEVEKAIGGAARMSWRKLRAYVAAERQASGNARYGEWFEWLVERLDAAVGR
jgi:hypothetical protein